MDKNCDVITSRYILRRAKGANFAKIMKIAYTFIKKNL